MAIPVPTWFSQIDWSDPIAVAVLNTKRAILPNFTGCYAFTVGPGSLSPGRVLYVGEAARQTLSGRVTTYLVDYNNPKKKETHKGKGFILAARKRHGDHGVYVRWVIYTASAADIHILEASLINYLNPRANDREEEARHPTLGSRQRLDARLIWSGRR